MPDAAPRCVFGGCPNPRIWYGWCDEHREPKQRAKPSGDLKPTDIVELISKRIVANETYRYNSNDSDILGECADEITRLRAQDEWRKTFVKNLRFAVATSVKQNEQIRAENERLVARIAAEERVNQGWDDKLNSTNAELEAIFDCDVREAMAQTGATSVPDLVRGFCETVRQQIAERARLCANLAERTRQRDAYRDRLCVFAEDKCEVSGCPNPRTGPAKTCPECGEVSS
jgi:hypothetical protein